jgi:hypothetical protein
VGLTVGRFTMARRWEVARHGGARGEVVVLSRLGEEEGRLPPPQWASWAGWVTHADWPAGPTRPKVRKEFF